MKKFIGKLTIFFVLVVGLYTALFATYAAIHPPRNNYFHAAHDKEKLLQSRPAPRVVFVGGSSVAFGINSGLIGKRCALTPVNMGLHLGIGESFMLRQVNPWLTNGDVVVLAPEYHVFTRYASGDPLILALLLETDPSCARYLTYQEIKQILDHGFFARIGNVVRSALGLDPAVLEFRNVVYRRDGFNQNGDLVSHEHSQIRGMMGAKFQYLPGQARGAIASLNEFHEKCRRTGVKVFLVHPPFATNAYVQYKASISALELELRRDLIIPILDNPQDAVFPGDQFFDTVYHLKPSGRDQRSRAIAESLVSRLRRSQNASEARDPSLNN
jgi:hypothetical protein